MQLHHNPPNLMPAIAERIKADEHDANDFLAIAVRLLRQRQLDRLEVRAKLAAIEERRRTRGWR